VAFNPLDFDEDKALVTTLEKTEKLVQNL
jgi:hypothetical protein